MPCRMLSRLPTDETGPSFPLQGAKWLCVPLIVELADKFCDAASGAN